MTLKKIRSGGMAEHFKEVGRGTIAPFLVNKIINIGQPDVDPFDSHYLDVYETLASDPESKVVDLIKAHRDCRDAEIHPDKIQLAYDNGARKKNFVLNKK